MALNPARISAEHLTEIDDEEDSGRWSDDPFMPSARRFPRDAWPPAGSDELPSGARPFVLRGAQQVPSVVVGRKAYEIHLTMVGKRHFVVAIHARSAGTLVDWHTDYDALTYEVIDCPTEVAEQAHGFLSAAGLTYGAFDFIVTADTEDYIFLECNAAGQWGWLAEECGLPIAEAIADELTGDDQ